MMVAEVVTGPYISSSTGIIQRIAQDQRIGPEENHGNACIPQQSQMINDTLEIIIYKFAYLMVCHQYVADHTCRSHEHTRQSVNRSEIDMKRKTCDIRTWEKHVFLDTFSTNIDTLVYRFTSVSKPAA
jgi:hypothetical protein